MNHKIYKKYIFRILHRALTTFLKFGRNANNILYQLCLKLIPSIERTIVTWILCLVLVLNRLKLPNYFTFWITFFISSIEPDYVSELLAFAP